MESFSLAWVAHRQSTSGLSGSLEVGRSIRPPRTAVTARWRRQSTFSSVASSRRMEPERIGFNSRKVHYSPPASRCRWQTEQSPRLSGTFGVERLVNHAHPFTHTSRQQTSKPSIFRASLSAVDTLERIEQERPQLVGGNGSAGSFTVRGLPPDLTQPARGNSPCRRCERLDDLSDSLEAV